jgi:hypothetical protein
MPQFGWVPADVRRIPIVAEPPAKEPEPDPSGEPGNDVPEGAIAIPSASAMRAVGEGEEPPAIQYGGPDPGALPPSSPKFVGGFGSPHRYIVHMAFGDGSIRNLNGSVDSKTLTQIGSRNDGGLPPEIASHR